MATEEKYIARIDEGSESHPGLTDASAAQTARHSFSVDVEEAFQVSAMAGTIDRSDWNHFAPRVEQNTRRILQLLDDASASATFFFLGWVAERNPALVREVAAAGHEIACHGWSHELIFEQTESDFEAQTDRSKKLLEDTAGTAVLGYRAASFSIRQDSLWALDVLERCGFAYDSSIFPVRHDVYGIPDAQSEPHRLPGRDLVEFPMTTVAVPGMRIPVSGGGYFRLYPYWLTKALLRRVASERPFVFYIHPWEVDPDQPREPVTGFAKFRHYNNLDKCEQRLRQLLSDFQFTSLQATLSALGLLNHEL